MIKEVLLEGSSILRKQMPDMKIFDKQLFEILQDLQDTMFETGAVGFAANQIGVEKNVCIVRTLNDQVLELVNPVVVKRKGRLYSPEGCLSIPNYMAIVPRYEDITIGHRTRGGKAVMTNLSGHVGIRAQHEIDHLNGILIRDYVDGINGKKGGIDATSGELAQ